MPGLTGLQLADPGELTPAIPGSTAPRPDEPIPGLPASDQLVGAGGLPNGPPDVTAPMSPGGLSPSAGPPEGVGSVPFSTAGGLAVPSAPGGEQIPPLQGLAGPLPSAGVPGVPASDQVLGGLGAPSGPPDLTAGSGAATTGAGLGAPAPAADQHRTPFAIPAGPTTPTMPAVPGVPGVTGATGALPGAPAPSDPVPTDAATRAAAGSPADVETGDPVPDGLSMPATPQPPVAVPDAPVPVPTPSTPYYFVAETSPYRGATEPGLDTLASAALSPSQVNPPTVDSLPGATGSLPKQPNLSDQPQTLQSPAFYFADRTPTSPSPGAAVGFPDPHPPFDVAPRPAGLPHPVRTGQRKAVGVARQCGDDAEAAGRPRSAHALLPARELQHPSRRPRAGGPGDRRLRGRPEERSPGSSEPDRRRTSSSSAARPRRSTWSPRAGAAQEHPPR